MISSLANQEIKDLFKLKLKKHRDQTNLFLVFGEHLIEEAIKTKNKMTADENMIVGTFRQYISLVDLFFGSRFPRIKKIEKEITPLNTPR